MSGPKTGGFSAAEYTRTMEILWRENRIMLATFGPASRAKTKLVVTK
jgi:hypothetical protein